jgi:hypothetical protein
MRNVPLLVTTLLLAAPVFAQQASSTTSTPASAATATADQPPAHPITPEQVHEILQLTHAKELARQSMRLGMTSVKNVFPPYTPKDVFDDIQQGLEKIDFESMATTAYQKHISTEDAAQIIAFYRTPVGQRLVVVMPAIEREMQLNGRNEGMRITQEVIKSHMAEIKAAAAKYKQEHSDNPTVTSPN